VIPDLYDTASSIHNKMLICNQYKKLHRTLASAALLSQIYFFKTVTKSQRIMTKTEEKQTIRLAISVY